MVRRSTAACFFLRVFVCGAPTAPDYKDAASCASASACASFALARSSPFDSFFDFVATFFSSFTSDFISGFGSAFATCATGAGAAARGVETTRGAGVNFAATGAANATGCMTGACTIIGAALIGAETAIDDVVPEL